MYEQEDILSNCRRYSTLPNMAESFRYGTGDTHETVRGRRTEDLHVQDAYASVLSGTHYGFVRTRKWHITEYDIGRGVVALVRKDPDARKRIEREKLTLTDVEYIIEKASFGIIKLELDRYDYD